MVANETYWALVDALYEARIDNNALTARVAELEGLLQQCDNWLDAAANIPVVGSIEIANLRAKIAAALPEEDRDAN